MNIIESYITNSDLLRTDINHKFSEWGVYDPLSPAVIDFVKQNLLPGPTTCLYSGGWRLDFEATYLEFKPWKNDQTQFHPNTLFVDHNQTKLFELTLKELAPANLLVLHNDWWTCHHPLEKLVDMLDELGVATGNPDIQVICSLPLRHVNFNKLKYSNDDIAKIYNGHVVNDSLVLIMKKI
jgi:hypothetical protein